jgi:Xaa-Pro aminopeptidase
MNDDIPRFSDEELARRRASVEAAMGEAGVDALLVYGANRAGSAVAWLSEWPATREAALVVTAGQRDALFIQFYNHVPAATRIARSADVAWGGPNTIESVIGELRRRGVTRLGLVGPITWRAHAALSGSFDVVGLDAEYTRMRLRKSDEEMDWMRRGAELSDAAIVAVRDGARPGMAEPELGAICEAAYLHTGATNHIHYFALTSMAAPDRCVPSQWPGNRVVADGDVITMEISAAWWGHAGQVLRTMAIGADPTPLYTDLHAVADAAYDGICDVLHAGATPADVVAAAGVIEDAGFTIYDDLVHGYGGGYFPPIIGSASRMNEPLPDMVFEEGMTVVVQPNVITTDERAGVQTGGLVAITADGVEHLQRAPRGLWRVG